MPLDAVTVSALAKELSERLEGGRIDKVQQPERDMLLLSLRAKGENLRLVIAAGTGNARAGITRGSFENPAEPPMFCMLMRKHLVGARILSVTQPEYERMLIFTLDTHDELGVQSEKKLAVELIGRSANAVLIGADGRIIDCMRRTEGREDIRHQAELVTANIYRLRRGDRSLECEDYYDPACPVVHIELDPLKTPQQNAAALYKEYNKLKAAEQHLTVLTREGERQLDYLNSVLDELERAETDRDLSDIRRELTETGYIRARKGGKAERVKPQSPLKFVSDDGLEILAGRSNAQNDELTLKLARRTDYWLHTQRVHGSHVIIRCEGEEPPPRTLEQAAGIAAYYSQARGAGKVQVDYTMVRNVRKPSGALPGKVIYTDHKTMLAESDGALAERLKR